MDELILYKLGNMSVLEFFNYLEMQAREENGTTAKIIHFAKVTFTVSCILNDEKVE